ncbi:PREDICTED: uncharacterized protein LOC108777600 [Cyphomyrmex costatus]|uniref:uncharacterized protein LOC108777600 n=1 Tax=Cyphomyrmex costatus TaxID=456900 RepID=UPI0008522E04|nr:PREDICTED: uncharacterized protein LOC108777600 [Cyphomyrmex costatus]XP_018400032.1 PREDICTED: uncharacterized protein LOC108777600 [Cyphomyrmex costatus]
MIAATYNCGCLAKLSALSPGPVGLQAPCSPCCFQPHGTVHHSQKQTAQCCMHSKIIKKPKHIYSTSKNKACCCINRKSSFHIPSCSQKISSVHLSSALPQYSCCCAVNASRMYSTPSRRLVSAAVSASKESMNKQFSKSRSKPKVENLQMSDTEQTPTDIIVSEIVKKEQPHKEIEAIINDNHVIIRMHKETIKEEYDPPCECIGQVVSKESALSQGKCNNGFVFDMAHGNLELCRTPREDAPVPSTKKTCEETGCRTVTLYPNVKGDIKSASTGYRMDGREVRRSKMIRPIDLEENPNIFLLRIKKHCDSGDKRQTIDLEFRAPRPWLPTKTKDLQPETLEEHEDTDKEHEDDIDKEYEGHIDMEHKYEEEYKDEEKNKDEEEHKDEKEHKDEEEHKDNIDETIDAHKENNE